MIWTTVSQFILVCARNFEFNTTPSSNRDGAWHQVPRHWTLWPVWPEHLPCLWPRPMSQPMSQCQWEVRPIMLEASGNDGIYHLSSEHGLSVMIMINSKLRNSPSTSFVTPLLTGGSVITYNLLKSHHGWVVSGDSDIKTDILLYLALRFYKSNNGL